MAVPLHQQQWEDEEAGTGSQGATVQRNWVKEDISNPQLPPYAHAGKSTIPAPFLYLDDLFDMDLVKHLVYQTNLYTRQNDLRTPIKTDTSEMLEDCWATDTGVPQVADFMSSERFRLMRARIHFSDNQQITATHDRFYKVRPVITAITNFLRIPETPHQSVHDVMVAYKGNQSWKCKQYICKKPDKWGYKFFCRASIDGIIHGILMYQGWTTVIAHTAQLPEEEALMNMNAKVVTALLRIVKHPNKTCMQKTSSPALVSLST
ncbi:piggyBac transposable element-derived protein 2-like [Macrobrachium rosenbergii]|uniref:piggyBac transposable element-derived protein 2-like n=1 Tax=Macrobrachium rosenbergii TaxID=79674 RepID=UPI0034D6860D